MRPMWQFWDSAISEETIDKMISTCQKYKKQTAGVSDKGTINKEHRRSEVRWITDPEIRRTLWAFALEANRSAFGFNITEYCEAQYTEYYGTNEGHYDWHMDTMWDKDMAFDRKLSLTIQLSSPEEYVGGEFEFSEVEQLPKENKNKGSVVVFPSYLYHRVKPVTEGTRKSLVAWFEGPRWR